MNRLQNEQDAVQERFNILKSMRKRSTHGRGGGGRIERTPCRRQAIRKEGYEAKSRQVKGGRSSEAEQIEARGEGGEEVMDIAGGLRFPVASLDGCARQVKRKGRRSDSYSLTLGLHISRILLH